MIQLVKSFWREYARSPSSYKDNVWGHIRNQMWHGWGIGFLCTTILVSLIGPWNALFAVLSFYVAVVEFPQWRRHSAELWDCVEDTAHVLACALVAVGLWQVALVQLMFVASGAMQRRG